MPNPRASVLMSFAAMLSNMRNSERQTVQLFFLFLCIQPRTHLDRPGEQYRVEQPAPSRHVQDSYRAIVLCPSLQLQLLSK